MTRYVYPIYETQSGNYYGAPTSVKLVEKRIDSLVADRRKREVGNYSTVNVDINTWNMGHPNDRFMTVIITLVDTVGNEDVEKFVIHRSKV